MGKRKSSDGTVMDTVRRLWGDKKAEGWSMQQLGERMGYPASSARASVSQWLKSHDTTVSVLQRFAKAVDVPLADIVSETAGKGRK